MHPARVDIDKRGKRNFHKPKCTALIDNLSS